jgi:hypothetical protein
MYHTTGFTQDEIADLCVMETYSCVLSVRRD